MTRSTPSSLSASVSESLTAPPVVLIAMGVVVLFVALSAASLRVVPEHQRIVVTRLGRVVRVVGPGLVRRIVGIERWNEVSLRPTDLLLGVSATTQDGVSVHLRAEAQCHVTDPARSIIASPDPIAATSVELEAHLAHEIGYTQLADLLASRPRYESDLPALVTGATSAWGVEVISLSMGDIEALLTADLLHSIRSVSGKA